MPRTPRGAGGGGAPGRASPLIPGPCPCRRGPPRVEAYRAGMVLSGAGDALGYRGSLWEYCPSGPQIQAELAALGGLAALRVAPPDWPVSDDTVLHLATAEALATGEAGAGAGQGGAAPGAPLTRAPALRRAVGGRAAAGAGAALRGGDG